MNLTGLLNLWPPFDYNSDLITPFYGVVGIFDESVLVSVGIVSSLVSESLGNSITSESLASVLNTRET